MVTLDEVLTKLNGMADPASLEGMSRYGMMVEKRLGVKIPDLRRIARETGKNHQLAQQLWETDIDDARILASMIDIPDEVTESQMEAWAAGFNSWDVCDQVCLNLFDKTPLAWKKVRDWHSREHEYVKRAAYALIACLAWHDKQAKDQQFIDLFPVIKAGASDGRNYVKKAVSWALRNIGKRNPELNRAVLSYVEDIRQLDSKSANWIAADVVRDITSTTAQRRFERL